MKTTTTLLTLIATAIIPLAHAVDTIPLTTTIPSEKVEGTPIEVKVPNLKPAASKAPELMVPASTELLSKGKPVSSSDDFPIIGDPSYVTDGEKDAGEGYFLELSNGLHWVQIDLENESNINAVWAWHFHSQRRAYHDVVIQISNDPTFATGVTTVFNNDFDNSASLGTGNDAPYIETQYGLLVPVAAVKGRYVRLYSQGNTSNDMNHYIEVEVFGSPAK
jgi:hypothetical protein